MSFGWSVGDILMAIEVIYEVGKALNSSHGSAKDRDEANQFLKAYNGTVTIVQQIYGPNLPGSETQNQDPAYPPPTQEDLKRLSELKELYDQFSDELAKYAGMSKAPDEKQRNFITRSAQKIQWHFFARPTIRDLRDKITAQLQVLQPALANRQFQGVTTQAKLYHEETLDNFDDIKTMIRVVYHHITTNTPSTIMPEPSDTTTLSRAPTLLPTDPANYTGYTTARQQITTFVTPDLPKGISDSLKRLRVDFKLHAAVKDWLTILGSSSSQSNILWLLDSPIATQCSAIIYSVLSELDRPILAFSCSHIDRKSNKSIPPEDLLRNTIYSFLNALLTYLDAHPTIVRQRIDTSLIRKLDGGLDSIPDAITVLGNLLDNLSVPCVLIIDNAEFLDKKDLKPHLRDLFALFQRRPDRAFATLEGSHKLLLTTKGGMSVLAEMTADKKVKRMATSGLVVDGGPYELWDRVATAIRGMKVREGGGEMIKQT